MPKYDDFEREVLDFFRREYLASAQDTSIEDIYLLVVEYKYGRGVKDPLTVVDWESVFKENRCPACEGMMTLQEDRYLCRDCGFTIPLELYDRASKKYDLRLRLQNEWEKLGERIKDAGFDDRRVVVLEDVGVSKAMEETEELERRKTIESRHGEAEDEK